MSNAHGCQRVSGGRIVGEGGQWLVSEWSADEDCGSKDVIWFLGEQCPAIIHRVKCLSKYCDNRPPKCMLRGAKPLGPCGRF